MRLASAFLAMSAVFFWVTLATNVGWSVSGGRDAYLSVAGERGRRALGASGSTGRSPGAGGGSRAGTGCRRSSGTSSSVATRTAPSRSPAISATETRPPGERSDN